MAANYWEASARQRKSEAIVNLLDAAGVSDLDAATLEESHWQMASTAAGVRLPSPTTRGLIIEMLRARREARERLQRKPVMVEQSAVAGVA